MISSIFVRLAIKERVAIEGYVDTRKRAMLLRTSENENR
jgi:hypothetical protein